MNSKILLISLLFCTMCCTKTLAQPENQNWILKWLFEGYYKPDHYYYDDEDEDYTLKIDLKGEWSFSIGDNKQWISPDYDDSRWEKIIAPADWENEGFHGYDGHAYYRIHFDGSLLEKNQNHFLNLGSIDDVDEAYVNGALVGRSGCFPPEFKTAYKANRKYYIPNSTIDFRGDNVITVRVYDDVLNGGITHGNLGIYTPKRTQILNQTFHGLWKFSQEDNSDFKEISYQENHWEDILVPSYWDNQGHGLYDGIAWYRKTFELEFELERNKNYYIILGKVDDFDITYLNGQKIGSTNDGLDYGRSRSYNKLRIYKIPFNLLNTESPNVLAVKVLDIGNDGGIYMGPIGIIEEENLTQAIRR